MINFLFALSEGIDLLLSVIFFMFGFVSFFSFKGKRKKAQIFYVSVFTLLTVFFLTNHVVMLQYSKVPDIERMQYFLAQEVLRNVELDSVLVDSSNVDNNSVVWRQNIPPKTIIRKNTKIPTTVKQAEVLLPSMGNDETSDVLYSEWRTIRTIYSETSLPIFINELLTYRRLYVGSAQEQIWPDRFDTKFIYIYKEQVRELVNN